jgi:hypothetical protein
MLISLLALAISGLRSARVIGVGRTEVRRGAFPYVVDATKDAAEVIRPGSAAPAQHGTALSGMTRLMSGVRVIAGSVRGAGQGRGRARVAQADRGAAEFPLVGKFRAIAGNPSYAAPQKEECAWEKSSRSHSKRAGPARRRWR